MSGFIFSVIVGLLFVPWSEVLKLVKEIDQLCQK